MEIKITTNKLVIDIETEENYIPPVLHELIKIVDDYPPHHVAVLLEHDPVITKVAVDYRPLPFK